MTNPQRNVGLGSLPDAMLCERAVDGDPVAFEVLARRRAETLIHAWDHLDELSPIVAGAELPGVADAVQEN